MDADHPDADPHPPDADPLASMHPLPGCRPPLPNADPLDADPPMQTPPR